MIKVLDTIEVLNRLVVLDAAWCIRSRSRDRATYLRSIDRSQSLYYHRASRPPVVACEAEEFE